jgi:hypothetical protein
LKWIKKEVYELLDVFIECVDYEMGVIIDFFNTIEYVDYEKAFIKLSSKTFTKTILAFLMSLCTTKLSSITISILGNHMLKLAKIFSKYLQIIKLNNVIQHYNLFLVEFIEDEFRWILLYISKFIQVKCYFNNSLCLLL